ncbi:WXG100 family type VII secretion target [Streptomyces sp. SAI-135]|uniref:WXG100 family type VII secretion target n=1 Tax=unclassified Streptomyces TaxID=2593676 RepID=UPI002474214C|nr:MULTISPECIES: WXG100 family type VII secretion target [unclassified Streptomyces]MDH6516095.1 WXG100 family type VII secretion target [Streptomyces sp. SAI-090]MDH6548310.1 WXG100 family type VII secretion target [Streptomyces sp. SAI-041]MDH6567400.1 WXG100 family type VII secretion target [Streptomyces sp. SAI-117]MDH6587667.1 WXG100 family type VII secretion target [Streptomyces sp. SAI-133]MDH6619818.1 WXG100 family type VII secretion target [Streptomyces sp. SAI-135]
MSEESVAEKVYEAGIEVVNPGGRPDVLRAAAKGWRTMGEELEEAYGGLDRRVRGVLGEHWRGESAEAFRAYWEKVGRAVEETVPLFEQAARGLEEAADNIEEINDEIHQIYLEIGVSIAASVALSFVTVGFSAAAGAANAVRLAAQAGSAASRLGRLLGSAARLFRYVRGLARSNGPWRLIVELGVQWGAGTGTGIATNLAMGKDPELANNAVNGFVGALGGKYGAGLLAPRLGGGAWAVAADGAVVGAASSVVGDTLNNLHGRERFDASQMALGAVAGGLTGGSGSAAVHRATEGRTFSGAHQLVGDVATNAPISFGLGAGGNISKDVDGLVNGNPNAEEGKDRPGAVADAKRDAGDDVGTLRAGPDPQRYGAFG